VLADCGPNSTAGSYPNCPKHVYTGGTEFNCPLELLQVGLGINQETFNCTSHRLTVTVQSERSVQLSLSVTQLCVYGGNIVERAPQLGRIQRSPRRCNRKSDKVLSLCPPRPS